MNLRCLSVDLVESLQKMLEQKRPIDEIVHNLESATLPGLIEYGCLRYADSKSVPVLPRNLFRTTMGIALCEVCTVLGLRSDGSPKLPVNNLDIRSVEFHLVPDGADLDDDVEWQSFLHRFERSARSAGFAREAAANLQSAFFEMAENTRLHSRTPVSALVGYEVADSAAIFSVADVGVGVLNSLRTNSRYAYLNEDIDAIRMALRAGVTCREDENGGLGFNSVFKALAEQWGQLRFRSHNGCVTLDGTHVDVDKSRGYRPLPIPGFQVSVCCRASADAPLQSFF